MCHHPFTECQLRAKYTGSVHIIRCFQRCRHIADRLIRLKLSYQLRKHASALQLAKKLHMVIHDRDGRNIFTEREDPLLYERRDFQPIRDLALTLILPGTAIVGICLLHLRHDAVCQLHGSQLLLHTLIVLLRALCLLKRHDNAHLDKAI